MSARQLMTDGEIMRSWRQAKRRRQQLRILAELNGCSVQDILHILRDCGCEV